MGIVKQAAYIRSIACDMDSINQKIQELQKCVLFLQTETLELKSEVADHRSRLVGLTLEKQENNSGTTENQPAGKGDINDLIVNDTSNQTYFPDDKQEDGQLINKISNKASVIQVYPESDGVGTSKESLISNNTIYERLHNTAHSKAFLRVKSEAELFVVDDQLNLKNNNLLEHNNTQSLSTSRHIEKYDSINDLDILSKGEGEKDGSKQSKVSNNSDVIIPYDIDHQQKKLENHSEILDHFSRPIQKRILKTKYSDSDDYECDKCNYSTSDKASLERHVKLAPHTLYLCNQCDKEFRIKSLYAQHVKVIHNKIKDFKCLKCSYVCSQKGSLDRHINRMHA